MSGARRHRVVAVIGLGVSAALLIALYRSVDVTRVAAALLHGDPVWLAVSVGLILPITGLRAIRLLAVAPAGALSGVADALRLTLAASALNVVAPAKTGDLVKSYSIARRSNTPAGVALAIVAYERLCDMAAVIFWCVLGWILVPPLHATVPLQLRGVVAAVGAACALLVLFERPGRLLPWLVRRIVRHRGLQRLAAGWPDLLQAVGDRRRWIMPFSLGLWLTHLFQIWLFSIGLAAPIPFAACLSIGAMALLAGQLPFTFAGLGARDVALVVLLEGHMPRETAAAMGILMATRGVLPPLFGLPMIGTYLASVVDEARRWRREVEQRRGAV